MVGNCPFRSLASAVVFAQLVASHPVSSFEDETAFTLLHGLAPSFKEPAEAREQERAILPKSSATSSGSDHKLSQIQHSQTHAHQAHQPVVLDSHSLRSSAPHTSRSPASHSERLSLHSEHNDNVAYTVERHSSQPHSEDQSEHRPARRPEHHSARNAEHEPMPKEDSYTEAFEYHVTRNATIALWSPHILARPPFLAIYVPECSVIKAFQEPDYPNVDVSHADVVVFNLGQVEDLVALGKPYLPPTKPKGQLWVAGCWEPRVYAQVGAKGDCSLLNDPVTMSYMDAVASYDVDSDFPAFFTPPSFEQMSRPAPDFKANFLKLNAGARPAIASTVTSDCRVDHRNRWFREIKDAFSERGHPDAILSYGKCNRTIKERSCEKDPDDVKREEGPSSIVEVWIRAANRCMAQPFQLISENTQAPWYVTEKVWNALATGAIPVYDGPPEVKKLVPPGSVLFADDFASTADLVDAMLSFTEESHTHARAWKTLPPSQWGGWAEGRRLARATLVPRLCEAAARRPKVEPTASEHVGRRRPELETPLRPSKEWLEIERHHNGQQKATTSSTVALLHGAQGVVGRSGSGSSAQRAEALQLMRAIRLPFVEEPFPARGRTA